MVGITVKFSTANHLCFFFLIRMTATVPPPSTAMPPTATIHHGKPFAVGLVCSVPDESVPEAAASVPAEAFGVCVFGVEDSSGAVEVAACFSVTVTGITFV